MRISVLIPSYGDDGWKAMAREHAYPSTRDQGAYEVVIQHYPEGSVATFRNDIARHARGDWLVFLDADDELAPGFVDAIREAEIRSRNLDWPRLFTPAVAQIRSGRQPRPFFYPECDFRTGNWLVIGTAVPKTLFWQIGGFHDFPHGLEDWNFWARCVRAGAQIVKVEEAVYRAHYNSRSEHHNLARNRKAYRAVYQQAKEDAWG